MKLRLMLIFIIGVGGKLNEQEENVLTDFSSYLEIKICVFVTGETQPSILKKFSASNIYTSIPVGIFDPIDIIAEQKTMILYKTTVNFPIVKQYFSRLRKVS